MGQITRTSNFTWACPEGVVAVTVELWGGGGAGGAGGSANKSGGGGGAGGQYAVKVVSVSYPNTYDIVVGTGGTATATNGNPGGDSTFAATTVVAKGGEGGYDYDAGAGRGTGSTVGGVGDTVYAGGSGGFGSATGSGGGGGGAGSTGTGQTSPGQTAGGTTSENGGSGGAGTSVDSGNGGSASTDGYGGAGGGATNTGTAGAGRQGFARLTWTDTGVVSTTSGVSELYLAIDTETGVPVHDFSAAADYSSNATQDYKYTGGSDFIVEGAASIEADSTTIQAYEYDGDVSWTATGGVSTLYLTTESSEGVPVNSFIAESEITWTQNIMSSEAVFVASSASDIASTVDTNYYYEADVTCNFSDDANVTIAPVLTNGVDGYTFVEPASEIILEVFRVNGFPFHDWSSATEYSSTASVLTQSITVTGDATTTFTSGPDINRTLAVVDVSFTSSCDSGIAVGYGYTYETQAVLSVAGVGDSTSTATTHYLHTGDVEAYFTDATDIWVVAVTNYYHTGDTSCVFSASVSESLYNPTNYWGLYRWGTFRWGASRITYAVGQFDDANTLGTELQETLTFTDESAPSNTYSSEEAPVT